VFALLMRDPQGSLTTLAQAAGTNERRSDRCQFRQRDRRPPRSAMGIEWVFIDTPPNMSAVVEDAIRTPPWCHSGRGGGIRRQRVQETILTCRARASPMRRDQRRACLQRRAESPIVTIHVKR